MSSARYQPAATTRDDAEGRTRRRRHLRQDLGLVALAATTALWLGLWAPSVSPVAPAPPPPAAAAAPAPGRAAPSVPTSSPVTVIAPEVAATPPAVAAPGPRGGRR